MTEPRRLKGHNAAVSCCIASRVCPGILATAGEDGYVCWYDLRCKDMLFSVDVGNGNPASSLCFKQGNEDTIYVATGNEVKCFDLHMVASCMQVNSYNYNKDEINQIVYHPKSSFLAAADDTGDVKIIDVQQQCLYKTLRAGHASVSAVVCSFFLGDLGKVSLRNVISGGLDSKLVMWDFSTGRPNKIMEFGKGDDGGQCFNPAFVHALAVTDLDMVDNVGRVCAVARGDGAVNVIDIEAELAAVRSKSFARLKGSSKSTSKGSLSAVVSKTTEHNDQNLHLDYSRGGHVAAVSSVAFSTFGEKGKFIISGADDKSVKMWDWRKAYDDSGKTSNSADLLRSDISLGRKVNSVCTTPSDSENLVVCDTSKVVKVYTVG